MKVNYRTVRRDSEDNHVHSLPNGEETQGSLIKPSQSTQFEMHTHLYFVEGQTHETSPAMEGPGHTHDTILGETSGPHAMPLKESFGPRNDSMQRIGREFQIRNPNGVVMSRGSTAEEAASRYDSEDTYDEAFAKKAIGVTDEETWEKAKAHSMTNFGSTKWPYVQHIHKMLGGK